MYRIHRGESLRTWDHPGDQTIRTSQNIVKNCQPASDESFYED
ncbi:MAG: hypothetical protein ABSA01_01260 [Anaerolineales bacterium]